LPCPRSDRQDADRRATHSARSLWLGGLEARTNAFGRKSQSPAAIKQKNEAGPGEIGLKNKYRVGK